MSYELEFMGVRKSVGGAVDLARVLVGEEGYVPPYPTCLDAMAIAESMYVAHLREAAAAERLAEYASARSSLPADADYAEVEAANELATKWAQLYVAQIESRRRLGQRLWAALGAWAAPNSAFGSLGAAAACMVHLRAAPPKKEGGRDN